MKKLRQFFTDTLNQITLGRKWLIIPMALAVLGLAPGAARAAERQGEIGEVGQRQHGQGHRNDEPLASQGDLIESVCEKLP